MRISELVNKLLELQEELGDVRVTAEDWFHDETVFTEVVGVSALNLGDDEHPKMVVHIET